MQKKTLMKMEKFKHQILHSLTSIELLLAKSSKNGCEKKKKEKRENDNL